MKAPEPWRILPGRNPERELNRLNRAFRGVSGRLDRATKLRRLDRWTQRTAQIVIVAVALYWAIVLFRS